MNEVEFNKLVNVLYVENKAYKITFKSNKEREDLVNKLKNLCFEVNNDYSKEHNCLFLSTFEKQYIGCWDTNKILLNDDENSCKSTTYKTFVKHFFKN
jgi:hypothetical protein